MADNKFFNSILPNLEEIDTRIKNTEHIQNPWGYRVTHNDKFEIYSSVTTLIKKITKTYFKDDFNDKKDKIALKCSENENSIYFGLTPEQIIRKWSNDSRRAIKTGTRLHREIEKTLLNKKIRISKNTTISFEYFQNFLNDHKNLKSFKCEMPLFDEELKVAGTLDWLAYNTETEEFEIYDWKCSKQIKILNYMVLKK